MNLNVLVIGCGSAGQRHAAQLSALGVELGYLDSDPEQIAGQSPAFHSIEEAMERDWQGVVIATPPDSHLPVAEAVWGSRPSNPPALLLEKPLCAFGQLRRGVRFLEEAQRAGLAVMLGFNWRWHRKVVRFREEGKKLSAVRAEQWRKRLPPWGILLDHLSHDLDLILFLNGGPLEIADGRIWRIKDRDVCVSIEGRAGDHPFRIFDSMIAPVDRRCDLLLEGDARLHSLSVEGGEMYRDVLLDFLSLCSDPSHLPPPSFQEMIDVQVALEAVRARAVILEAEFKFNYGFSRTRFYSEKERRKNDEKHNAGYLPTAGAEQTG